MDEAVMQILRYTREVFEILNPDNPTLDDLCWDTSQYIARMLLRIGYSPIFVQCQWSGGWGHCYLLLNNHVLDITATQFGWQEPVVCMPMSEARRRTWWREISYTTQL